MTFAKIPGESDLTAKEIVNTWSGESISNVLYGYGEERYARRIAREIVESRIAHPIEPTTDLVEVIQRAVPAPYTRRKTHFATKSFQALRIAVNDELKSIEEGMSKAYRFLETGGRIAVISFHSIEDRIVKNYFKKLKAEHGDLIITKKPIIPSREEVRENPRSRSAKLRILQKTE